MEFNFAGLQMPATPEQPAAGQIVLRPLERGFGHTLGNAMRRILLSSLPGAAVWAFRADGVLHEHQTIPGVVEDVHEIVRNLKALVLRMDDEVEEATIELVANSAGPVTARNIRTHAGVDVVNPDHHILELQDDHELKLELFVNKGRGFVLGDQHVPPRGMPADLVQIDAIYNPVIRANFIVGETRVGQRTDFDRLVLEVETNGAIDAASAVQYAARLAIEHFSFLAGGRPEWSGDGQWGSDTGNGRGGAAGRTVVPARLQELLRKPIDEVAELSVRSVNSLKKENIQTVQDLIGRTEEQMLAIDNFGRKSLQEISDFLAAQELAFGMQVEQGTDGGLYWTGGEAPASDAADNNG